MVLSLAQGAKTTCKSVRFVTNCYIIINALKILFDIGWLTWCNVAIVFAGAIVCQRAFFTTHITFTFTLATKYDSDLCKKVD